jgi:hypothetical protein
VEQSAHRKFRAELTSLGLQLVESAVDDPDPIAMINAHGVGESQESLGCWNECSTLLSGLRSQNVKLRRLKDLEEMRERISDWSVERDAPRPIRECVRFEPASQAVIHSVFLLHMKISRFLEVDMGKVQKFALGEIEAKTDAVELFVRDLITQNKEAEEQFAQLSEELENLKDESQRKLEEMKQILEC